jgi:8-oxo-dGTP pyrophosphatase MutT (NUDIX family)
MGMLRSLRIPEMNEISAGVVLIAKTVDGPRALLIRVRKQGFEIPKGHVEPGETTAQAAIRELREETGLESELDLGAELGVVEYSFQQGAEHVSKRVHYFVGVAQEPRRFGSLPKRTRELRWVSAEELADLALINEALRPILARALSAAG